MVVDPVGGGLVAGGKLCALRLADNYSSEICQPVYQACCFATRLVEFRIGSGLRRCLDALEINDVLYCHSHPVQRFQGSFRIVQPRWHRDHEFSIVRDCDANEAGITC